MIFYVRKLSNLILNLENIESKIMLEISKLKEELVKPTFPEKIGNFNSKFHVQGQYYFILKDENTNKNVYIPHYEVARWFYFTTPSMTKQILSASLNEESSMLKGLYKNIIHINSKFKEITLTQNANTKDAANIFRYVTNEYVECPRSSRHIFIQLTSQLSNIFIVPFVSSATIV
jgi:hypothetical protein